MEKKYDMIILRKDGDTYTINGYYGSRGARLFDVLHKVEMAVENGVSGVWLHDAPVNGMTGTAWCVGWAGVSLWMQNLYGLPLYGMDKADAKVMEFLKDRETMMDRALGEYILPKGQRKGFPPGKMDQKAVQEVESFSEWKRRKEYWDSVRGNNVASSL